MVVANRCWVLGVALSLVKGLILCWLVRDSVGWRGDVHG